MTVLIRPLPLNVVHLIAASEVIDSLAAVVRELVENSLDAGATRMTVSLWPEQWRVQVTDNGIGINLTNLKQAATAHSTSKISTLADLNQVRSLGFRGEALHSLAQLANLEIASRCAEASGWRISYDSQGKPIKTEAVAIAPGTIITVSNLFTHWPARRQALPSPAQQLRGVQLLIQSIALCHPHVTWQIFQGAIPWLQINPGENAQFILPQLLRSIRLSDLQYLRSKLKAQGSTQQNQSLDMTGAIELVLGLPDRCHRRRPDWVKVAVNGRMVRLPEIEQTVLSALSRTCPRDRYPVCFVHLQVPAEQVDWNRHPAKEEIYLHNLPDWQNQVHQGIDQALRLNAAELLVPLHRAETLLKVSENAGTYQAAAAHPKREEWGLLELKAIAQVHNTYIVAEHPNGLWLVEQHIAHERVLFEQICDAWQLVPLEPPIVLQQLTESQLEQLQRLNLEVDPFGENLWAVRNAPALLAQRSDCAEALTELSLSGDLPAAQAATACRSAIRNGTPLSLSEMQTLLDQWVRTPNPRTCPHGRPIYLRLDESSLARFFRRHWVIGKSHGI
ncbi:MAG: DNA mismatch repair endonuclease MutL [Microcoleaceae cyanobacterium]